jgi:hypothetical protein
MGLWSMLAAKLGGGFAGFYSSRKPTTTGEWAGVLDTRTRQAYVFKHRNGEDG